MTCAPKIGFCVRGLNSNPRRLTWCHSKPEIHVSPADTGLRETSPAVCQPSMYAQVGAQKEQSEVLRLLTDNKIMKYLPW